VSPIGKRSLGRYGRKLRVTRGRGKTSTDARVKAVADIRNVISFGEMNQLMVNIVNPALIINSDATQYESAMDSSENVNIVYVKKLPSEQLDRGEKIGNKVLPNEQSISLTQFFIKYYLLISAVGLMSTPVYIIADDNIPAGECVIEEVPMLSNGLSVNDTSYCCLQISSS